MRMLLFYFKKYGGFQYLKNLFFERLFFYAVFLFFILPKNIAGLKQFEEILSNKRLLFYKHKFKKLFKTYNFSETVKSRDNKAVKTIWFLWLQGLENAPPVVRICYNSLLSKLKDYKLILLTSENINKYAVLPDYILEKWHKGFITNTHFSDILRLELLITHGGIWLDSTVLLMQDRIPKQIEDADLFYFQVLQPGYTSVNMSSWFMVSKPNNRLLCFTRECLYTYWRENNKLYNYFLLHYCIMLAAEKYPEVYENVPKYSSAPPHVLQSELFEPYNEERFAEISDMCFVQKLTYKFDYDRQNIENTFYYNILHSLCFEKLLN